ncbi:Hypothetical protein FKW44_011691, partial [Caligus rogercresseyi]
EAMGIDVGNCRATADYFVVISQVLRLNSSSVCIVKRKCDILEEVMVLVPSPLAIILEMHDILHFRRGIPYPTS